VTNYTAIALEPERATRRCGIPPGPRVGFRWDETTICYAIDLWHRRHLRPPKFEEWLRAAEDHPSASTVLRRFGSWNAAIRAAGLRPRRQGSQRGDRSSEQGKTANRSRRVADQVDPRGARGRSWRWPADDIVLAIKDWHEVHGSPPRPREWMLAAPNHPSRQTVMKVFGHWARALEEAGLA
jgi:hypothetical protein